MELTTEQLHWLLDGIDIEVMRRHPAGSIGMQTEADALLQIR
jgi:hypothetical protein